MAEQSYKVKVVSELLNLSKVPNLTERQKKFLKNFANDLVKKNESEIKKSIYATFRQGGARGGEIRGLLPILPDSSELKKTAFGKKPEYKKGGKEKLVEMFADEGGANVLDQRKEEYWPTNPNLDDAKIEAIAKANGLTKQELYKRLQEETNKETRRQIATGEEYGGWTESPKAFLSNLTGGITGLVFPRGIEAIKEGKDVTKEDIGLDLAENLMYTINPASAAGKVGLRALGKFAPAAAGKTSAIGSKIAGFGLGQMNLGTGLNAFSNPILFETADAILYDEGPRANFNTTDVIAGGITNLVVPTYIRSMLMRSGKIGGVKRVKTNTKALETAFGETDRVTIPTFEEYEKDLAKKMSRKKELATNAEIRSGGGNVEAYLTPTELKEYQNINTIYDVGSEINEAAEEISKIIGREGVTLDEATKRYFATLPEEKISSIKIENEKMGTEAPFTKELKPTNSLLYAIKNSDWAQVLEEAPFMTPELEKALKKSATRQMLLNSAVNWASNKYGDTKGGGLLGMFPFYDVAEKRKKEEEEKQKEEERAEMQGYIFPFESEESEGL